LFLFVSSKMNLALLGMSWSDPHPTHPEAVYASTVATERLKLWIAARSAACWFDARTSRYQHDITLAPLAI
jgi:hypothetical protein